MSAESRLNALLAPNAPAVKVVVTPPVTSEPVAPVETIPHPSAVQVKNGTVKTVKLAVQGFSIEFTAGAFDDAKLAAIARAFKETTNPWYAVAVEMANGPVGFLTIRRAEGATAKDVPSPLGKLDAAITMARKRHVKNHGRLDATKGQEKGVWYLIRRP